MIHEVADEALNLALKYADHAEVYIEKEDNLTVDIKKDRIDFAKESFTLGVGIRVILEGKMGFAYTTNTKNLKETAEKAIFNARCNIADENFAFAKKYKYPTVKNVYDKKIESFEIKDSINFAKTMIDTAIEEKCEPTSGGFSAANLESFLVNSEDVKSKDVSTYFSGFISVNVHEENEVSTAHESDSSRYFDVNPEKIAGMACEIVKDSIGGRSTETKNLDVVLDYHAVSGLLATFVNALNADNVQRGRSVFAGMTGEEVAAPSLSIYDDGTIAKGLNSSKSDGEGTPSQMTTLVEYGVLKNFLYDIYTSNKGKVASTGNGIRSSFSDVPAVGLSNCLFQFQDVVEIRDIKEGLLVTDVLGAHTSNPISGDFSVEASNAFKIEKGEVVYPVKKAMLSGNIFQSLKDASAISKKTRQIGPFIVPRTLIRDLRVVG
jgi:PmbA protein